jgi:hypothetical protein
MRNRLVYRMSAVSALNNLETAPYPTIAGRNIFDSKIEPMEDYPEGSAFPICVIYTDYDQNHWSSWTTIQEKRLLTTTFELLIVQSKDRGDDPDAPFQLLSPYTDSEMETALDIFEQQLFDALTADNPAAECFRSLTVSVENIISRRGATTESGQRLSARQITLEANVLRDPIPGALPAYIASFLDAIELKEDYAARVAEIRGLYTSGQSIPEWEKLLKIMGWSDQVAGALGTPRSGPMSVLPPNVTWLKADGNLL